MLRVPALLGALLALAQAAVPSLARAEDVNIAVAANFTAPMKALVAQFEKDTAHKVAVSLGATGKFYAQIKSGAPFDLLLSADDETPARLEKEGSAVLGSRFTYAVGRLALWSATPNFVDAQGEVLKSGKFANIALASPKLAPYGAAAVETLTRQLAAQGVQIATLREQLRAEYGWRQLVRGLYGSRMKIGEETSCANDYSGEWPEDDRSEDVDERDNGHLDGG